MDLLPIEKRLFAKLTAERAAAVAPIEAEIRAAVTEVAERVGIPAEFCGVNLGTGQVVDLRPADGVVGPVESGMLSGETECDSSNG